MLLKFVQNSAEFKQHLLNNLFSISFRYKGLWQDVCKFTKKMLFATSMQWFWIIYTTFSGLLTKDTTSFLSLRLEGKETSKHRCICWFNIVCNDHGRTQKWLKSQSICRLSPSYSRIWKKNIFYRQVFTHLIQCTVLETQFWSVKCTTVIVGYAKISNNILPHSFPFSDACNYNW